ncbi:hypothetical protein ACP4OV_026997 [Aristida adscensionis]
MASSPSLRPTRKTGSRSIPEADRCTHVFEIAGYSLHQALPAGEFIRSTAFAAGGHDWSLVYYPNGDGVEVHQGYASLYLELLSQAAAEVRVVYDFRLLDTAGVSWSIYHGHFTFSSAHHLWGFGNFLHGGELEDYLWNDIVVVECDVSVLKCTPVSTPQIMPDIHVPPSALRQNLGDMLESWMGADVTFKVEDKVFPAHKIVLAMRSPVFKAELYGPMSDSTMAAITVEDMQPGVFKALLHFIYRDLFPVMDDLDARENEEMVKHLLVAADRYGIERLKVMCESILVKGLTAQSVADTLALADQHHCSQLKDACIGFINSSARLDDVVASQGYAHLKRACPTVIAEILEKSARSRKV